MARVQPHVAARSWDAFRLMTLEKRSGKDTAAALGLEITTVYMARSRVHKMLRKVIQQA